ncbi:hypothetical protein LC612_37410 [Nostoc sp. CHAB 5834]|nr:hypothetical protein [Nostoc sp. CHAB 5834]
MTTQTVSLSRAHKIAERLQGLVSELYAKAEAQGGSVVVTGGITAPHVSRLRQQGLDAMETSEKASRLIRELAGIRTALAMANADNRVSELLAEIGVIKQVIAHKKKLLKSASLQGTHVQDLPAEGTVEDSSRDNLAFQSVAVNVLGERAAKALEKEISELQAKLYQLDDALAQANTNQVTLKLTPELLKEVTGA